MYDAVLKRKTIYYFITPLHLVMLEFSHVVRQLNSVTCHAIIITNSDAHYWVINV